MVLKYDFQHCLEILRKNNLNFTSPGTFELIHYFKQSLPNYWTDIYDDINTGIKAIVDAFTSQSYVLLNPEIQDIFRIIITGQYNEGSKNPEPNPSLLLFFEWIRKLLPALLGYQLKKETLEDLQQFHFEMNQSSHYLIKWTFSPDIKEDTSSNWDEIKKIVSNFSFPSDPLDIGEHYPILRYVNQISDLEIIVTQFDTDKIFLYIYGPVQTLETLNGEKLKKFKKMWGSLEGSGNSNKFDAIKANPLFSTQLARVILELKDSHIPFELVKNVIIPLLQYAACENEFFDTRVNPSFEAKGDDILHDYIRFYDFLLKSSTRRQINEILRIFCPPRNGYFITLFDQQNQRLFERKFGRDLLRWTHHSMYTADEINKIADLLLWPGENLILHAQRGQTESETRRLIENVIEKRLGKPDIEPVYGGFGVKLENFHLSIKIIARHPAGQNRVFLFPYYFGGPGENIGTDAILLETFRSLLANIVKEFTQINPNEQLPKPFISHFSSWSELIPKEQMENGKIFISHIAGEKKAAIWLKEIYKKVFGDSIRIFCASDRESIPPGEEWYKWITENILSASIVVILISPKSQSRPWVNFEAGMARGALKKVIPVVYLGAESTGIDFPLSGLQAIMLRDPSDLRQIFDVCESNLNIKCHNMKWDDLFRDFKKIMDEISKQYSTATESQNIQPIQQQTFDELAEEYTHLLHNVSIERDDTFFSKIDALVSKMLARAKKIPKRTHTKILRILAEYQRIPAQHLHILPKTTNLLGEILVIIGPYVDR